eukprot:2764912-Prymnesium_polylepis.1
MHWRGSAIGSQTRPRRPTRGRESPTRSGRPDAGRARSKATRCPAGQRPPPWSLSPWRLSRLRWPLCCGPDLAHKQVTVFFFASAFDGQDECWNVVTRHEQRSRSYYCSNCYSYQACSEI